MTGFAYKDATPERCVAPSTYQFGSYAITSTLALPALPRVDDASGPHVEIDWHDQPVPVTAAVRHTWLEGSSTVLSLAVEDGLYWLTVPGIADFRVQASPHRIGVHTQEDPHDETTLEHQLVDQVLPRLLDLLGELMVHASAVRIDGRHALFLGPSGAGKSTLAGLLQRRGHQVLSDDCVQLIPRGERWSALPTYPSLRLLTDSIEALYPEATATSPVSGYSEKRRLSFMEGLAHGDPGGVDVLYVIQEALEDQQHIEIVAISPLEACLSMIRHSFRMDISDHDATARHLSRCSEVARSLPAFQLSYPRDFGRHDAIAAAIRQHVAGSSGIVPTASASSA